MNPTPSVKAVFRTLRHVARLDGWSLAKDSTPNADSRAILEYYHRGDDVLLCRSNDDGVFDQGSSFKKLKWEQNIEVPGFSIGTGPNGEPATTWEAASRDAFRCVFIAFRELNDDCKLNDDCEYETPKDENGFEEYMKQRGLSGVDLYTMCFMVRYVSGKIFDGKSMFEAHHGLISKEVVAPTEHPHADASVARGASSGAATEATEATEDGGSNTNIGKKRKAPDTPGSTFGAFQTPDVDQDRGLRGGDPGSTRKNLGHELSAEKNADHHLKQIDEAAIQRRKENLVGTFTGGIKWLDSVRQLKEENKRLQQLEEENERLQSEIERLRQGQN